MAASKREGEREEGCATRRARWKARESTFTLNPRPTCPDADAGRRARYSPRGGRPSSLSLFLVASLLALPRHPLSTSRRLSQWQREERRSIRVDVLLWPAYAESTDPQGRSSATARAARIDAAPPRRPSPRRPVLSFSVSLSIPPLRCRSRRYFPPPPLAHSLSLSLCLSVSLLPDVAPAFPRAKSSCIDALALQLRRDDGGGDCGDCGPPTPLAASAFTTSRGDTCNIADTDTSRSIRGKIEKREREREGENERIKCKVRGYRRISTARSHQTRRSRLVDGEKKAARFGDSNALTESTTNATQRPPRYFSSRQSIPASLPVAIYHASPPAPRLIPARWSARRRRRGARDYRLMSES